MLFKIQQLDQIQNPQTSSKMLDILGLFISLSKLSQSQAKSKNLFARVSQKLKVRI